MAKSEGVKDEVYDPGWLYGPDGIIALYDRAKALGKHHMLTMYLLEQSLTFWLNNPGRLMVMPIGDLLALQNKVNQIRQWAYSMGSSSTNEIAKDTYNRINLLAGALGDLIEIALEKRKQEVEVWRKEQEAEEFRWMESDDPWFPPIVDFPDPRS